MNPQVALADELFRRFCIIVGAVLAGGGATLATLSCVFRRDVRSLWATYWGWLMIVPIVLGAVLAGRSATIIAFGAVALLAVREFARATGLVADRWMTGVAGACVLAACAVTLVPDPATARPGWYGLYVVLPVYATVAMLMVPVVRNRAQGQLRAASLGIIAFLYIGWMFGHLAFLANSDRPYAYLLYLVFAVAVNDVAAFVFGKLFGRHRLCPNVSPKKTWEGALGALAVSMALPWALTFALPHFGVLERVLAGLIVGVGGQAGDLAMSVVKRDLGIKDMDVTLPGHGGILDRIDSMIFAAPLFFHMVRYFYGI